MLRDLIQTLQAYHEEVVRPIQNHRTTVFEFAASDLIIYGMPGSHWDYWKLLNLFNAIFLLPDRPLLDQFLFDLLHLLAYSSGKLDDILDLPVMTPNIFSTYSTPKDQWLVGFLLKRVLSFVDRSESTTAIDAIIKALGQIQDQRAVEPLLQVLSLKGKGALALAELGCQEAIPGLLRILDAPDPGSVMEAVTALGDLRAWQAIDRLTEKLKEILQSGDNLDDEASFSETELARALIRTLVKLNAQRSIEALQELVKTATPDMRVQLSVALNRLEANDSLEVFYQQLAISPTDISGLKWIDKWEISKRLVELPDGSGLQLQTELYLQDENNFPHHQRDTHGRLLLIHELGDRGDASDMHVLEWIERHDFAQTDVGWTISEEAKRAKAHLQLRMNRNKY